MCICKCLGVRGEKENGAVGLGIFIVLVRLRIKLINQINLVVGLHCRQFELLRFYWWLWSAWLSITDQERVKLRYCACKNLSEGCTQHTTVSLVAAPRGSHRSHKQDFKTLKIEQLMSFRFTMCSGDFEALAGKENGLNTSTVIQRCQITALYFNRMKNTVLNI